MRTSPVIDMDAAANPDIRGLLFDLDGTLLDSAPDLTAALNRVRAGFDLSPVPVAAVRKGVSRGARGMLELGLPGVTGADLEQAKNDFLQFYAELGTSHSEAYAGVAELLHMIEGAGMPWGIVTNKYAALTLPIVRSLGWHQRAAAVICGDTAAAAKPSPLPVLMAAEQLQLAPSQLLMVGDDVRDIEAGQAAGCATAAVAWGYGEADLLGKDIADHIFIKINDMSHFIKQIIESDSGLDAGMNTASAEVPSSCQ
jgi:phosphoglycolate phosphatase